MALNNTNTRALCMVALIVMSIALLSCHATETNITGVGQKQCFQLQNCTTDACLMLCENKGLEETQCYCLLPGNCCYVPS
ncbi:hypothetical protein BRADI_1g35075v3 [Brachypodium distachyon]|uniref:Knottin scorpion toxin-like domain-containing protein n=1 Tax=Brachypodium distachyon TaxID=15368 RepID=A0A2K2DMT0_BRADI|nr:hypothetical protein BRADI_1g35075v3 [Brachypodium distachyon]